jgi:cell division transport system permease protein
MRAGFLMSEVRIGLRRNLTMTFAVIVTVAISLSLLGIGLLLQFSGQCDEGLLV